MRDFEPGREDLIAEIRALRSEIQRLKRGQGESPSPGLGPDPPERLLSVNFPVGIAYTDSEQKYRFVNKTYEEWFGLSMDKIRCRPVREVIGDQAYQVVRGYMERALAGERVSYEARVPYAAGSERHIHGELVPDVDSTGTVLGYFLFIQDITARKTAEDEVGTLTENLERRVAERTAELRAEIEERARAEERLRESEERFRLAMEAADEGLWDWDIKTDRVYRSPAFYRMLGVDPDEFPEEFDAWSDRICEDHRDAVFAALNSYIAGASPEYSVEFRMNHASGRHVWILSRGKIVKRDPYGNPLRMIGTHLEITDRKTAEEALRQSERKYRSFVEQSLQGVVVAQDNPVRLRFVSGPMQVINGYTPEEMMSMGAEEVAQLIHPDDREKFFGNFRKRISGADLPPTHQYKTLHRNGETRWVEIFSSLIDYECEPAVQTVFVDVTDRKRIEEALRESEERFRAILDHAPVMINGFSPNGEMIVWNREMERIWGWTRAEAEFEDLLATAYPDPDEYARVQEYIAAADSEFREYRPLMKNGEQRTHLWAHIRLTDGSVISVGVDVTDRKKAEELVAVSAKLKAVAELSGGVAHNFNNLLQIVLGGAQLALTDLELGNVNQAKENLEQIIAGARFGAQTVKRLQDFAQVEKDRAGAFTKVFDLSETVTAAVEMSKPWWKTKPERDGVSVVLNRDLEAGCYVKGNENETFEVIVNLIKNAAEALPRGGEMTVRTAVEGDTVLLVVQDSGVGITEENLERVFEPFWTTKGPQGAGMGLAGAYGVIRGHGGEISVESRLGEGSLFTVRLPCSDEQPDGKHRAPRPAVDFRLNILVADDMPAVVKQLRGGLTAFGQTVLTAASGREALEIMRESHVDVVVCDLAMPEMNGRQVAEEIAALCEGRGIPKPVFILLTGWGGQVDEEPPSADSIIDFVLVKPVDVARLLHVIKDLTPNG